MAHVEKFAAPALGNMLAHYERAPELGRGYRRVNIDETRSGLNYNLAPTRDCSQVEFINQRIDSLELKKKPRKDAIRMVDWVVTQPRDLAPDESRAFFEACYKHLEKTYGEENVVSAYVHLDEQTPHMHFAFVPVTQDGRLSAKSILTRVHLKAFHEELQDAVEKQLGHSVGILLDETQKGEKQLSALNQTEYIAAKERLESLRQEVSIAEAKPVPESIGESIRTLAEARGAGEREEELRRDIEGLRERIRAAETEKNREGERISELDARIDSARERTERVKRDIASIREYAEPIARVVDDLGRKLRARIEESYSSVRDAIQQLKEYFVPRSLDENIRLAKQSIGRSAAQDIQSAQERIALQESHRRVTSRSHGRRR